MSDFTKDKDIKGNKYKPIVDAFLNDCMEVLKRIRNCELLVVIGDKDFAKKKGEHFAYKLKFNDEGIEGVEYSK